MFRSKELILASVTFACLALWPSAASAQSAIGGTVKDTSGAVLPGVTVEASSDVLIEKTRAVVTDSQGNFKIVDLRPGTYSLTFSLEGFSTMRREGLELPSNFTATVNADLKVGALEESLTVTGSSPVVDVQSNTKTQVLSRDVLDAVPSARTIQSLGQLVVGVTLSSPDVGGSRAMQQTYFVVHGVGASGSMVTVDGLITNGTMGDGAVMAYHNEAMIQEAVYQTAGGTGRDDHRRREHEPGAEGRRQSLRRRLEVREVARVSGRGTTSRTRLQGARASARVDKIDNFYEVNIEQGGPILKDKLWFFAAFRHARYDKPIANTFFVPARRAVFRPAIRSASRAPSPASRAYRTRRWTTRSSASPGR